MAYRKRQFHTAQFYISHANVPLVFGLRALAFTLKPQIRMAKLVMGIVLKANSRSRRPLGMLLCDALLSNACQLQLLSISQLRNKRSQSVRIADDRVANPLVGAHLVDHQVARINFHDLSLGGALRMKGELNAALLAVLFAFAITGIDNVVGIFRVQRDQTESMCDELISQNTAILLNFNKVDGNRGHLGLDDSTKGVREGKIDVGEVEVDVMVIGLSSAST